MVFIALEFDLRRDWTVFFGLVIVSTLLWVYFLFIVFVDVIGLQIFWWDDLNLILLKWLILSSLFYLN